MILAAEPSPTAEFCDSWAGLYESADASGCYFLVHLQGLAAEWGMVIAFMGAVLVIPLAALAISALGRR